MERYQGVRGKKRVARIVKAIEASGATVTRAARTDEAPFLFEIRTASGEDIKLVCYAFTANKYKQGGRPKDEHRLQVKYGSEFHRPHELYIDPTASQVTLMFGVHEELDLFVAVDPAMHNPTWFSSSIEFKEENLTLAKKSGWHGWERDRVAAGRRQLTQPTDMRTEVLLAVTPKNFLNYVLFERNATGMDAGERLLLIDQISERLRQKKSVSDLLTKIPTSLDTDLAAQHTLLKQLGLKPEELLEIIGERFRLLAAVRGGVAEYHLGKFLKTVSGIKNVTRIDEDGKPDFEFSYKGKRIRMECKNVLRKLVRGAPRVDFQKTRASKNDPCSRYYAPDQFEVLAACVHPVTEKWEFKFTATATLEKHSECPKRLSQYVQVEGKNWSENLTLILDKIIK